MAENLQPIESGTTTNRQNQTLHIVNAHPAPRVNLLALAASAKKPRHRERSATPSLRRTANQVAGTTPMATDRNYNVNLNVGSCDDDSATASAAQTLTVTIDTTRMQLISPPPEEMLRRGAQKQPPFTPSLLATPRQDFSVATTTGAQYREASNAATPSGAGKIKRKRSAQQTPKARRSSQVQSGVASTSTAADRSGATQWEATPNPKPRKQVRRDVHQPSQDVDMESPTRSRFGSTPPANAGGREGAEEDALLGPSTPSRKAGSSIGRRDGKHIKRIVLQSPHVNNPDADYIPPASLLVGAAGEEAEEDEDRVSDLNLVGASVTRRLLGARSSRRSATPIPMYEPPTDVFTPPREVFMSPPQATSRRTGRKSAAAKKKQGVLLTPVVVKQEMPDIDFSAPMPPPSPTDDPLLLSSDVEEYQPAEKTPERPRKTGKERTTTGKSKRKTPGTATSKGKGRTVLLQSTSTAEAAEVVVMEETTRPSAGNETLSHDDDDDLPPSSPPPEDSEDEPYYDWTQHAIQPMASTEEDSMMEIDPADEEVAPVQLLDFDAALLEQGQDGAGAGGGGWSDTDEEEGADADLRELEGQGEYTGRWRMMKVRTKADPPSSATRGRMDLWGRPVSPFPKVKKLDWGVGKVVEGVVEEDEGPPEEDEGASRVDDTVAEEEREEELQEEEEVMRLSMEPEDVRPTTEGEDNTAALPLETAGDMNTTPKLSTRLSLEPEVHGPSGGASPEPEHALGDEGSAEADSFMMDQPAAAATLEGSGTLDADLISDPLPVSTEQGAEISVEACLPESHAPPTVIAEDVAAPRSSDLIDRLAFSSIDSPSSPDNHANTVEGVDQDMRSGDDDDGDLSDFEDLGVVKIVSADPRAAARAAAILKQHDYECLTKVMVKQRQNEIRRRYSSVDDLAQGSRRRSVLDSGVSKAGRRRRLTMGVVGDKVFIPGSPVITLPELLQQAEEAVLLESPGKLPQSTPGRRMASQPARLRDPFVTPLPARYQDDYANRRMDGQEVGGEKAWTKEEWKLLDSCLTDERLEVAGLQTNFADPELAPVDAVSREKVVDRFVQMVGGAGVLAAYGSAWSSDSLIQRVRALQNKQRSGNVAPPTTPYTSPSPLLGGQKRKPSMEVPDFTPLGRRALPPRKPRPSLPQPVTENAPFSDLPPVKERPARLPATLLAPRYSHLLDEAIAVSHDVSILSRNLDLPPKDVPEMTESAPPSETQDLTLDNDESGDVSIESIDDTSLFLPRTPSTFGHRLKGILFSYIPTLSKTAPAANRRRNPDTQRGLPLPPKDLLEKPRGPVVTPARAPPPKVKHPKELVELHPAPAPPKPSMLPRPKKPQRLVELHPVPAPPEPVAIPRPRRSSGGSVKDLVKGFEEMREQERARSKSSLGKPQAGKRVWRP